MSHMLATKCSLCLGHAPLQLASYSLLFKSPNGITISQLARIASSCHWNNKTPYTAQTPAAVTSVTHTNRKGPPQDLRIWKETPSLDRYKKFPQYCLMLSKFRLTSLVVMTSMAGYALAPAPFEPGTFVLCALGTGLVSAAANSVNQFFEVPFDAQMSRTKNRVLVLGLLEPIHAVTFAAVTSTVGLSTLYWGVNGLTAALGAANLLLYTSVYTPLKRVSILNTWVGSVVGAIPPLMGWVGCSGSLDTGALVLGAILFSWQFPHFNALSWNLRADYSKAGYRMMVVTEPALCRRVALRHTGIITGVCLASPYLEVTNTWFALESLPLNIYFMYLAWQFYKNSDRASSRKLFRFSLLHLPLLMMLMLVNKKYWGSTTPEQNETLKVSVETTKLSDQKRITVLPRGPVVAAQETECENEVVKTHQPLSYTDIL